MITGNIGDWAAASEAAHAAGNGMQCNGYHSEEPYPVPDRRRSGRNDSATHTTQFETLDASALTLRLAEVDGAIAQYQAEATSLRKLLDDHSHRESLRKQADAAKAALDTERKRSEADMANVKAKHHDEIQRLEGQASQLRESLNGRLDEISHLQKRLRHQEADIVARDETIKTLHQDVRSAVDARQKLEARQNVLDQHLQGTADVVQGYQTTQEHHETRITVLERENQQWGEAYNQLQSECNVMRDRGTSSAYSWPSHDMQEPEAPGLLPEEDLVDRLKSIVPVGARNACRLAQSELVSFFNSLAPLNWTSHYLPRYGAIFDFVRSHPDVFHTAPDNAFYQPEASLSDLSSEASSISYPHLQRLASSPQDVAVPPPNSVTSSPQPIARPRTTTAPQEPRLVFGEGVPSSAPAKQAPVPAPASLQQPAPAARGARFEQPQPEQAALPEAQQPQYSQQQVGAQLAAMLPHVAHLRQGGALGAPAISSGLPAGISQTPSAAQQHMSLTGQQGPKKGRILLTPGPAQAREQAKAAADRALYPDPALASAQTQMDLAPPQPKQQPPRQQQQQHAPAAAAKPPRSRERAANPPSKAAPAAAEAAAQAGSASQAPPQRPVHERRRPAVELPPHASEPEITPAPLPPSQLPRQAPAREASAGSGPAPRQTASQPARQQPANSAKQPARHSSADGVPRQQPHGRSFGGPPGLSSSVMEVRMEDLMQRSAQQAKPGKDKEARQPQGSQQHGPKAKREPAGNAPARGTGKQKGSASQPAAPVPLKQPAYQVKEHSHVHSNPFDGLDQDGRVSDDSDSTGRRSSQPGSIKEGQQLSKDDQLPSRQIVQSHAGGSRSKAGPEGTSKGSLPGKSDLRQDGVIAAQHLKSETDTSHTQAESLKSKRRARKPKQDSDASARE